MLMTLKDLLREVVAQFENDMRFDCHRTVTKLGRSAAAKKLLENAREALPLVIEYFEGMPPIDPNEEKKSFWVLEEEIQAGFAMLLADLGREINAPIPSLVFGDRAGWIAWGKEVCKYLGEANGQ